MPNHLIRRLAILGAISIFGIVMIQGITLTRSYDLEDKVFDQTVRGALYQVAEKLAITNKSQLPTEGLVQRKSSNYYAVNINDIIDANILEDYLYVELGRRGVNTNFEYAVYDCQSQDMVYGNYCHMGELEGAKNDPGSLPKFDNLIYYFVVGFPSRQSYLIASIWQVVLYSVLTLLALFFFIYALWVILQQKKLSELQKDFINNMTHEFKTPISSIKIAANVLNKDPSIQKNERLKKYGQIIIDQNERLNQQVEKVLNLAKLEQDSFKLNFQSFDAIDVIRTIVSSEELKMKEKGAGNISFSEAEGHFMINADKLHFSNVLYNIIDNAIKYCYTVPDVIIKTYQKGKDFTIEIRDNGIGINTEHFENLFKKFYRVPTGDLHDVKGFGLGLYYVKNICQAHGWNIQVTSVPGSGSVFTIKIPYES